ncbi:MAG: alkaline phosphatase family protein [Burkholderiales bacterium]|nr:alkaline phosphatase family protein [Burkholderiales bacterium]MDE2276721.1 alkaline phosphatase family protein [Burkholderiales bacterium]
MSPAQPTPRAEPSRIVVVVADGLRADVAAQAMGYVAALLEAGQARATRHDSGLPSLSRPLYATLLTGRWPLAHGILSNQQVQACGATLFDDAHAAGLRSAIVAYHWFCELLGGPAFAPLSDRRRLPEGRGIVAASWYFEDDYPDSHVIADAEALRLAHEPDLLFVHPMGPDDRGHRFGGESDEYRMVARRLDMLLALAVPRWHGAGYDVLLTSDHGMGRDRMHGGTGEAERSVPLVWMPRPGPGVAALLELALPAAQTGLRDFLQRQRQARRVAG